MATIVFCDLETGGLEMHHPVIQLAAIAVVSGVEVDTFERKIEFDESECEPEALELNGYNPLVWAAEAVPEVQVVKEFAKWLGKYRTIGKVSQRTGNEYTVARMAGQNFRDFDGPRLRAMFERHETFLPADTYLALDTLQLALWATVGTPAPDAYKLEHLCARFGIEQRQAHDALDDIRVTVEVARCLYKEVFTSGPVPKKSEDGPE